MASSSPTHRISGLVLWTAAGLAHFAGAVWRVAHLLYFHRATDFMGSDMAAYEGQARLWALSPGRETIADIVHPPGGYIFFGIF